MKGLICFIAICIAVAYCDVKENSYDHDKAYGSEKEYGSEKKYGYESKDKSHEYDDDSRKKAYKSEKEYGQEKKYGYESADQSYSREDYGHGHDSYSQDKSYHSDHHHGVTYNKQYTYHGKYSGHCGKDGFYYRDHSSFVICSNDNAYVQPCAPGSRNSGLDNYDYGAHYNYRDFCDVNLVDHGYGVKSRYGYGHQTDKSYHGDHHSRSARDGYDRKSHNRDYRYGSRDRSHYGRDRAY